MPPLVFLAFAMLAAVPWGAASASGIIGPLLPAVVLHAMNSRSPGAVPEWLTFLGGLSLDALTQGPLGYFALVYLMAYVMAAMTPVSSNRLVSWLRYAPALVVVLATAWLVSSLYMLRAQDVMGYIEAGAVAFCAFPVLSWLLQPLTPAPVGPGAATYTRGAGL